MLSSSRQSARPSYLTHARPAHASCRAGPGCIMYHSWWWQDWAWSALSMGLGVPYSWCSTLNPWSRINSSRIKPLGADYYVAIFGLQFLAVCYLFVWQVPISTPHGWALQTHGRPTADTWQTHAQHASSPSTHLRHAESTNSVRESPLNW